MTPLLTHWSYCSLAPSHRCISYLKMICCPTSYATFSSSMNDSPEFYNDVLQYATPVIQLQFVSWLCVWRVSATSCLSIALSDGARTVRIFLKCGLIDRDSRVLWCLRMVRDSTLWNWPSLACWWQNNRRYIYWEDLKKSKLLWSKLCVFVEWIVCWLSVIWLRWFYLTKKLTTWRLFGWLSRVSL